MKWYERLKQAREAKGIKKSHFAAMIGVKPATITEWERGDTESPAASNVLKICECLSITPDWLMNGTTNGIAGPYVGANDQVRHAVKILEGLPESDLLQLIAIIDTFAAKSAS